jgi:hypothetical protein
MRSAKIASLLNLQRRFLRSIQLERDFRDPSSLNDYVLTPQVKSYLNRLVCGLAPNSGQRAWRITGDYGSGKSSFALLLARLFGDSRPDVRRDHRRAIDFAAFKIERPRLRPILVTGSREPLGVALLRAVARDAQDILRVDKTGIARVIRSLTAKSEAQGDTDNEIVGILRRVARAAKMSRKASGVLLLIDELGKFLEFGALRPDRQDIYLLQRLAEAASQSGAEPLYIVGLLHQGFSAYAENLSPGAQREWEKVAGRFEEMVFAQPLEDVAFLIADALKVRASALSKEIHAEAKASMDAAIALGWYGAAISRHKLLAVAIRMYPLHATVLPILIRLFSRFGQNERSLFGFMLSTEPFGLREFANAQNASPKHFYELHNLYDYVRSSFGNRLSAQSFRSHWNHIESLVESFHTESEVELKVLKTVGLLNILDAGHLLPTEEALCACIESGIGREREPIFQAIRRLKEQHVLYYIGAAGGYCLWPHTSVNLEKAYEDACQAIGRNHESVMQAVKSHLATRPLVARRHYIETGNLRHFTVQHASLETLEDVAKFEPRAADGTIAIALCESEEQRQKARAIALGDAFKTNPCVLVAVPQPLEMLSGLVQEVMRWEWILRETRTLNNDKFALDEVSRQLANSRHVFIKRLNSMVGVHSGEASSLEWFYKGQKIVLRSGKSLTSQLSLISEQVYASAPFVHNELVNRRALSSAAAAARMRLIEGIFQSGNREYLGMDPTRKPPEMSIYLSLLKDSGLHRVVGGNWQISIPVTAADPCYLGPVLQHIREMAVSANMARVPVSKIFEELKAPPFGVRDGLLPILLAVFASAHEQHVAFYDNGVFMPEMAGLDIMRLAKVPEMFEIQYCDIGGVRSHLFSKLLTLISTHKPVEGRPDLLDVVRPMCVFAANLPRFTQTTRHLSNRAMEVRRVLLSSCEPAGLIFRELPLACGFDPFTGAERIDRKLTEQFVGSLRAAITELQMAYPRMLDQIKESLRDLFRSELSFSHLRERLAQRARQVVIGVTEPRLRAFCNRLIDVSLHDTEWVESLGSLMCAMPPQRWSDLEREQLQRELELYSARFERVEAITFSAGSLSGDSAPVRVCLTAGDGSEVQRVVFTNEADAKVLKEFQIRIESMVNEHKIAAQSAIARVLWNALASEEK